MSSFFFFFRFYMCILSTKPFLLPSSVLFNCSLSREFADSLSESPLGRTRPASHRIILVRCPGISLTDSVNVFGKKAGLLFSQSSDSCAEGSFVGGREIDRHPGFWNLRRLFMLIGWTFWPAFMQLHTSELPGRCHLVSRIYLHQNFQLGLEHLISLPLFHVTPCLVCFNSTLRDRKLLLSSHLLRLLRLFMGKTLFRC